MAICPLNHFACCLLTTPPVCCTVFNTLVNSVVCMSEVRQLDANPHGKLKQTHASFVLFIFHRKEQRKLRVTQFISDIAF